MKHTKTHFLGILFFCAIALFTGCSEKIAIKHNADNSILLEFNSAAGKNLSALISSFTGMSANEPLFDERQTAEAVKAHGGTQVRVKSKNGADLELSVTFAGNQKNALSPLFAESSDGTQFVLTISPESMRQFIALLPEDTAEYTELLIAPIFTGDKMSAEEYVQTLAAVYGNDIAGEMRSAKIEFSVTSKKGIKQILNVSLAEILSSQETKKYTFDW